MAKNKCTLNIPDRITIEGVEQVYRNYSGEERKPYNALGRRNFCIFVTPEWAEKLEAWGANVKYTKPRDEYDEPRAYIKINVNFNSKFPPRIVVLMGDYRRNLDESTVDMLDFAEIINTDVTINPFFWNDDNPCEWSAYLKTMYVTVVQDELDAKYNNYDLGEDEIISETLEVFED